MSVKQKILIVDDDEHISELISLYLIREGYDTKEVHDGRSAVEAFLSYNPDLIMLDIMLPVMDGYEVCKEVRKTSSVPIIMLTAKGDTIDKVLGLELGADDYIVKPFDLDELGARVAAHLRREGRRREEGTLRRFFGEMSIDYGRREITVRGTPVALSKTEFDIVELLSVHTGQIFDREHIYEAVWGLEGEGSSDTVMEHVRKIRAKLAAVTDEIGRAHV